MGHRFSFSAADAIRQAVPPEGHMPKGAKSKSPSKKKKKKPKSVSENGSPGSPGEEESEEDPQ